MTITRPRPSNYSPNAPEIATEAVVSCPVCAHTSRERIASGYDYEIETCANEWVLWRCDACTAVWLDPRPATSELGVIYPPTYYAYEMDKNISPLAIKGKEWLDRKKFAGVLKIIGREPASFLDIGCGNGRYLEMFAKRGMPREKIYGLELSDSKISELRKRGFNAYCRRVEDCSEIPPGSIDLATMFHVIEHVADPLEVIEKIGTWLSKDGHLVLETPNIASLDARLFNETYWGGYHIPRHWTLFNAQSLAQLLDRAGFELEHLSYQTGHSFWMYSFHHVLKYNARLPMPRLAQWFSPTQGLAFLLAFTGFDLVRRSIGFRTSAMLAVARKR